MNTTHYNAREKENYNYMTDNIMQNRMDSNEDSDNREREQRENESEGTNE